MLMTKPVCIVWALKSPFSHVSGWAMVYMGATFLMHQNLNKEKIKVQDTNCSRIMLQIHLGARERYYRWDDRWEYQEMRNKCERISSTTLFFSLPWVCFALRQCHCHEASQVSKLGGQWVSEIYSVYLSISGFILFYFVLFTSF